MTITPLVQLKANRTHAMNAYASVSGVTHQDALEMRIAILEGGLSAPTVTKYQAKINAQKAEFDKLDAIYEADKAAKGL